MERNKTIDWEQRRYEIAKELFPSILKQKERFNVDTAAIYAINCATSLIYNLKKAEKIIMSIEKAKE